VPAPRGGGRPLAPPTEGNLPWEWVRTFFDSANQAEWQTSTQGGGISDTDYSAYGFLTRMDLGANWSVQALRSYNVSTGRLEKSWVLREGADGYDYDAAYRYDKAGNVLGVDNTPTATGVSADRQCFAYDGLRRLTSAWTPGNGNCATAPTTSALGGADPYWTSYGYDSVGNRTSVTQHVTGSGGAGGATSSQYTYPAAGGSLAHAVSSVTTTAAGGATATASFTYDSAGNMTGRNLPGVPEQTLKWDAEGELASVAQDGNGDGDTDDINETDTYTYSADGERLARVQDGTVTVYMPWGTELSAPVTGQQGTVAAVRHYQFAGESVAVRTKSGTSGMTTVMNDHHNTAVLQVNQATNTVTRRYTDPFGATRGSVVGDADANGRLDSEGGTPKWAGDHGFLDKPTDTTGLVAIGARMYDAVLGRFISVDPVMDLADPQQWNAYQYGNSNPVTMADPTGELPALMDGAYGSTKSARHSRKQTQKGRDRRAQLQRNAVEALPTSWRVPWSRNVARAAPVRGRPGTYVPPPRFSTSGPCSSASCAVGATASTLSAIKSHGDKIDKSSRTQLPPPQKLNLDTPDLDGARQRGNLDYWRARQQTFGAGTGAKAIPGNIAGDVYDASRMQGWRYAGRAAPFVAYGAAVAEDVQAAEDVGHGAALIGVDTGAAVAGGILGAIAAGAVTGALAGSVAPGVGTLIGAVVGAVVAFAAAETMSSVGKDRVNAWRRED
jgi:RHS repeat-associated protein